MSKIKKFFVVFFLFFFVGISLISPHLVKAQESTWYARDYDEWFSIVFDPNNPEEIFGERYTYAQVEWIIYSLIAFILRALGNESLISCVIQYSDDLAQCTDELITALTEIGYSPPGGDAQNSPYLFAFFNSNPLSGISYVKERLSSLKIVPEVKAQGFGFSAAQPVREIWKAVRDASYFMLVLIMVVLAFMVMFRMKTSVQTVITIQSAIPKIIGALILITFSYAIAGFMIDLMYVILGMFSLILSSGPISDSSGLELFSAFSDTNILSLLLLYFLFFFIVSFISLTSSIGVGGFIIWLILVLIMTVVLFIAGFKILFVLIKNFVYILLTIIVGPIMILSGSIGGGGFSGWIKSLFSYLMVYPVTACLLFLAFFFLRASFPDTIAPLEAIINSVFPFGITNMLNVNTWSPPFTRFLVGSQNNLIWLFASIALISLIPKVAEIAQSILKGKPFSYGSAIGEGLAPFAAGAAIARSIPGRGFDYASARQLERFKNAGPIPSPALTKENKIYDMLRALTGRVRR